MYARNPHCLNYNPILTPIRHAIRSGIGIQYSECLSPNPSFSPEASQTSQLLFPKACHRNEFLSPDKP